MKVLIVKNKAGNVVGRIQPDPSAKAIDCVRRMAELHGPVTVRVEEGDVGHLTAMLYPRLSETGPEAVFTLVDTSTTKPQIEIECGVEQEPHGISVRLDDCQCGDGRPVFIEYRQAHLVVHVWTDPENESPTHTIEVPLEGTAENS